MNLLKEENFKSLIKGAPVKLFTLRNANGCIAQFSNYGARWLSMWVPDREGNWLDIILGYDHIETYLTANERYHGAIVGRVSGRMRGEGFILNGVRHSLANNDLWGKPLKNHIHGGIDNFSFRVWEAGEVERLPDGESVSFHYMSKDGEEGYPGNLSVTVTYKLTEDNTLSIHYHATTDQPTIVNLTSHGYFNLSGDPSKNILEHILYIPSEKTAECDDELLPTGRIISLKNTVLDFNTPRTIGSRLDENITGQVFAGKGYVGGYVFDNSKGTPSLMAQLTDPDTGIRMELFSDQPFLQLYNAWLFDGSDTGKNNIPYQSSCAIALEAQGFNDAPHHENFPSIVLRPGEVYRQRTVYRFLVKE